MSDQKTVPDILSMAMSVPSRVEAKMVGALPGTRALSSEGRVEGRLLPTLTVE